LLDPAPEGLPLIRTAVVGASGYSGAELVGLLAAHPDAGVAAVVGSTTAGRRWEDLHPGKAHLFRGEISAWDPEALAGLDVVFLALPHGESAAAAAALVGRAGTIIDLSGDLRLADPETYRAWYGREHPAPELLGRAVYGLAELFGDELPGAGLVACPGCYPTAVQLAAGPALRLPGTGTAVTATAVSGTSGAGRSSDPALSFSEMFGDARAYRVGRHQHVPEMAAGLERYAGRPVRLTFVPHLIPIERGILATVVVPLDGAVSQAEVLDHYRQAYAGAPFVRVLDPAGRLPAVRDVAGSNRCDLAPVVDEAAGTLVVVAAIDNLVKGAAGQAVQVMNRVLGLSESAGLSGGEEAA
jgi:N-acetyl-gamma-glutamyl-phosphate reductase